MRLKTFVGTLFAILAVFLLFFVSLNIAISTNDADSSVFATTTTLP